MALPLVTTLVALFYLGAVPVQIAVRYKSGRGFGVGIAPFEGRFALRRALKPMKMPEKTPEDFDLSAIIRGGRYLLRHIRMESIRLTGSFGSDDAALTALVCGGVNSLGYACRARSGKILINLRPDFNASALCADVSGMISVRIGHIIFAALLSIIEYASGRLKPWTNTPSKAL